MECGGGQQGELSKTQGQFLFWGNSLHCTHLFRISVSSSSNLRKLKESDPSQIFFPFPSSLFSNPGSQGPDRWPKLLSKPQGKDSDNGMVRRSDGVKDGSGLALITLLLLLDCQNPTGSAQGPALVSAAQSLWTLSFLVQISFLLTFQQLGTLPRANT